MEVLGTKFSGVKILIPQVFADERGYFSESFNQRVFNERVAEGVIFVQDNHSYSVQGVLRGLHYQIEPTAQAKLVRVGLGEVFCVIVDLRPNSETRFEWLGVRLSAENKQQLWVPEGFAHGFYVVSQEADYLYKTTDYYSPEHEKSIAWNDSSLAISWPLTKLPILSPKDAAAPSLERV